MKLNRGVDEQMPDTLRFQSWQHINRLYVDSRPEASAMVRQYYGRSQSLREKIAQLVRITVKKFQYILTRDNPSDILAK